MSDPVQKISTAPAALPEESEAWKQAYRDPHLVARRSKKHRQKLERLGIFSWPRDTRLLDLCCGTGEMLRILHAEGFSNLSGIDVTLDPELRKENWLDLKAGVAKALPYSDQNFDAVICLHSLHHLGGVAGVNAALNDAWRVIKPGGRLALIDHYDSAQLRLAFWACRQSWLTWPTSGLRSFKQQLDEEWRYLTEYLDHWAQVRSCIDGLRPSRVEIDHAGLFFFYWIGQK